MTDLVARINEYLSVGGLFNPELMDHEKVRDLLIACRDRLNTAKGANAGVGHPALRQVGASQLHDTESESRHPAGGPAVEPTSALTFQGQVTQWMHACFGEEIARDRVERNHRFLEEALELVQANGCGASEAHQLVDYVFNRPAGELVQEVGGVMVTLAALCSASDALMDLAAKNELARVWTKIDVIRAKQAAKPKHSPLPGPSEPPSAVLRADLGDCSEPGSFEQRMETFERVAPSGLVAHIRSLGKTQSGPAQAAAAAGAESTAALANVPYPEFCLTPKECAGRTSCRRNPSCCE